MLIEFALHLLPTLRSSIEVNANLMRECLIDYSGGRICYGFDHMVRLSATGYIPSVLALRIIS